MYKCMKYLILNTVISIEETVWDDIYLHKFSVMDKRDSEIEVKTFKESKSCGNIQVFSLKEWYFYLFRLGLDSIYVDCEKRRGDVVYPFISQVTVQNLILQLLYANIVKNYIVQFHASLVKIRENGLMFLGPSGIGKTTQAELWNQYRDALIINGDVVFVQETSDAFLGWGTPWHGSSPYCENTSVPVKALIVLKQAQENSIRELTGFEKVTAVSNNVFYPRWLEGGMELCLETLNHLLSALPVYELSCRPDEEAVRLTEEAVFGGSA